MARSQRRRARTRSGGSQPVHTPRPGSASDGPAAASAVSAPPLRPTPKRRFSPFGWLRKLEPRGVADVIAELRKVTWPTAAETRYLTFVVAVVAIAFGIILGLFDLAFGWAIEQVFFE